MNFISGWTIPQIVGAAVGLLFAASVVRRLTHPVVKRHIDLANKVVIVTGGNRGIGQRTAHQIAGYDPSVRVIIACRDTRSGEEAAKKIIQSTGNRNVEVMELDLIDYNSIRQFVKDFEKRNLPLHILINNAGIMTTVYKETPQGIETTMAINHFGTFLLTNLLLPKLKEAASRGAEARVVTVSSGRHIQGVVDIDNINGPPHINAVTNRPYNNSKLANVLFAFELNRHLAGTGVTSNVIHPGVIATSLHREDNWYFRPLYFLILLLIGTSEHLGAQTQIYAAASPDLKGKGGLYLARCAPTKAVKAAYDENLARKLWDLSVKQTGLNK